MRRELGIGVLLLVGCGTDNFTGVDGGGGGDGASSDGTTTLEGGGGPDGGDAMATRKPRLFVSLQTTSQAPSALLGFDDPDGLTSPKQPDVQILLPNAIDIVSGKNKRLFVAGFDKVPYYDKPLELTSSSMPTKTLVKADFVNVATDINVTELAFDNNADILATADNGVGLEIFKNASGGQSLQSMVQFGTSMDAYLHVQLANGQLVGGKSVATSNFFNNAPGASGPGIAPSGFVIGNGTLRVESNRLHIAQADQGVGGAVVFGYTHPIPQTMASPLYTLKTAFGMPVDTDVANDTALSSTWLAVSVKNKNALTGFICVFDLTTQLDNNSTCKNKIPIADGVPFKLVARKGALYSAVNSGSGTSFSIYRSPLTDQAPTVKFPLGMGKLVSGFAFVDGG